MCYLSSSENVHIEVKLFAVRKAGGMSYSKDLWSTYSGGTVLEIGEIPLGASTLTVQPQSRYGPHQNLM